MLVAPAPGATGAHDAEKAALEAALAPGLKRLAEIEEERRRVVAAQALPPEQWRVASEHERAVEDRPDLRRNWCIVLVGTCVVLSAWLAMGLLLIVTQGDTIHLQLGFVGDTLLLILGGMSMWLCYRHKQRLLAEARVMDGH